MIETYTPSLLKVAYRSSILKAFAILCAISYASTVSMDEHFEDGILQTQTQEDIHYTLSYS